MKKGVKKPQDNLTYNANFSDYQNEIRKQRRQSRIDMIGLNGNEGLHYEEESELPWDKPTERGGMDEQD